MEALLDLTSLKPIDIQTLILSLLICIALSSFLSWFYIRYGRSFSNRSAFARNLTLVSMTTLIVIQVVQSSLAISLGLVGALSIVRFRTAVKEPEELAFMFLAITIGLGLGANQHLATIIAVIVVFLFLLIRDRIFLPKLEPNNLYIDLNAPTETTLADVETILTQYTSSVELRRFDGSPVKNQFTFLIQIADSDVLNNLSVALRTQFPESDFSIIDQINTFGG